MMTPGLKRLLFVLLLLLLLPPSGGLAETAQVLEVFDGDTIRVLLDRGGEETVRYLLIDTPELHHPQRGEEEMGRQAARANRDLVLGRKVRLEMDVLTRDRYGRLLAYVWIPTRDGEVMASRWLVEQGYALPFVLPPNVKHVETIRKACQRARSLNAGLWRTAAPRLFSPDQAWSALDTLRGHFLTLQIRVERVIPSGKRWLLLPEDKKCAVILYDSDRPLFGDLKRFEGQTLLITGKLRAGFRGAEIYLRDPSQLRISTKTAH